MNKKEKEDMFRRMELMIIKIRVASGLFHSGCVLLEKISRDFHNRIKGKQS